MIHQFRIVNNSVNLGIVNSGINSQLLVNILDANDSMRPFYLRAVGKYVWFVCGVGWMLAVMGSYFRYILYSFMFKKYRKHQLTPIDVLIFVSTSLQHLTNLMRMVFYTILISDGNNFEHWEWQMKGVERYACSFFRFSVTFELYYNCVGSVGLSIYRILYIKHDSFVKYTFGERNLLFLILGGGILITTIMALSTCMNDYEQLLNDHCHFPANKDILVTLDEYQIAGGHASPYIHFSYPRITNGVIMVGMTFGEIFIYIAFFHFVYKHDNSDWLKKILDKKAIKKRNKTNAITFFGQFCSFLFELSYWILCLLAFLVGKKEGFLWASASFLRFISFCVMAAIDVLVSSSLRPEIFKSLRKLLKRIL